MWSLRALWLILWGVTSSHPSTYILSPLGASDEQERSTTDRFLQRPPRERMVALACYTSPLSNPLTVCDASLLAPNILQSRWNGLCLLIGDRPVTADARTAPLLQGVLGSLVWPAGPVVSCSLYMYSRAHPPGDRSGGARIELPQRSPAATRRPRSPNAPACCTRGRAVRSSPYPSRLPITPAFMSVQYGPNLTASPGSLLYVHCRRCQSYAKACNGRQACEVRGQDSTESVICLKCNKPFDGGPIQS